MSRVTASDVSAIFETNLTDSQLDVFITSANAFINAHEEMLVLSDAVLFEIERWLSAHYASARDQRIRHQDFGNSKATFQGEYKYSFYSTDYGQRAMDFDTTGTMNNIANGKTLASIETYPISYPCKYSNSEDCDA